MLGALSVWTPYAGSCTDFDGGGSVRLKLPHQRCAAGNISTSSTISS